MGRPKKGVTPGMRISSFVEEGTGCWNWIGYKSEQGYGKGFWLLGRVRPPHQVSYELFFQKEIEEGLQIDHLCKNPSCVNPLHLEMVTPRINNLRSGNMAAKNFAKTHCKNGHEFTKENTRMSLMKNGFRTRVCKECYRRVDRARTPRNRNKK